MWRENFSSTGNVKYKDSEVGSYPSCSMSGEEADVAELIDRD